MRRSLRAARRSHGDRPALMLTLLRVAVLLFVAMSFGAHSACSKGVPDSSFASSASESDDAGASAVAPSVAALGGCPCTPQDICHTAECDASNVCIQRPVADGSPCSASNICVAGVCKVRACGDGFREPGPTPALELCDDGNVLDGDGCDSTCLTRVVFVDRDVADGYASLGTSMAQNVGVDGQNRALVVYRRRLDSGTETLNAKRLGDCW